MGNNQSSLIQRRLLHKRKHLSLLNPDQSKLIGFKKPRTEFKHYDISDGFPFGAVVLAKLKEGDSFWPAVVVYGCDVGQLPAKRNHYWVFWLGCQQISQVKSAFVIPFDESRVPQKVGKQLARGLTEAKEEVKLQLCIGSPQMEELIAANSCTLKVRVQSLKLTDFCIACDDPEKVVVRSHPIFVGGVCGSCLNSIKETIFDCGIDGAGSYCVICAKPGDLLVCDHADCLLRTFCTLCISRMDAPNAVEEALSSDTWLCYLCRSDESSGNNEECLIRSQPDWRTQLMLLFGASKACLMPPSNLKAQRRPITVLSVFDGISTAFEKNWRTQHIVYCCYPYSNVIMAYKEGLLLIILAS